VSHIHYTPEAEKDLAAIKEYIAVQLENPVAAVNTVTKITKHIRKLEQFPELGSRLSAIIDIVTDYRFFVCANYLAFYRIDGNDVHIIRVLYGRRDYVTIMFGKLPQEETKSD
jgi:plasmid stabilization system protein ParE